MAALALLGQAGRWVPTLDAFNSGAPLFALAGAVIAILALFWAGRLALFVGLAALLLSGERMAREYMRPIELVHPAQGGQEVTIVTHNVLHMNSHNRETMDALATSGADVLLLQETDGLMGLMLPELTRRYPYSNRCPSRNCGVMILSRWPIVATRYRIRDEEGREVGPPLFWATVAPPGGAKFDVVAVHLPWPVPAGPPAEQQAELAASIGHLDLDRMILAGDFNLTPWAIAMDRLDAGLAPLTRVTRGLWSFPARIGPDRIWPFPVLPIDHVLVGPGWAVKSVERLPRTGSDHYPVRVRLVARG